LNYNVIYLSLLAAFYLQWGEFIVSKWGKLASGQSDWVRYPVSWCQWQRDRGNRHLHFVL